MYQIIKDDNLAFWDVDDTLLIWSPTDEQKEKYGIDYYDEFGELHVFVPHLPHIEQIKKHHARGHKNIVWSQGGYLWAEKAIKLLQLEKYITLIISKPKWAYDDLTPNEFIKVQWMELQK